MIVEAIFMHDPIGFKPVRSAALVEDERLAHADPHGLLQLQLRVIELDA